MAERTVYLFGAPHIEQDGKPVPVQRRKAVALLAYLAARPQSHGRDSLAALLWPEWEPTRARAALRRVLVTLKNAIGQDSLQLDQGRICLPDRDELWVDIRRFRRLLAQVHQHRCPRFQQCDECMRALTEAAALNQGDFLAGFSLADTPDFDEWQLFEAESLRRELGDVLERLSCGFAGLRDFPSAIQIARRWLALDTLHEPAHRTLMRFFFWAGDRTSALRQYQECVDYLAQELKVSPQAETTELYQHLRDGTFDEEGPAPRPKPREISIPDVDSPIPTARIVLPTAATAFVGRTTELAQLAQKLADPDCHLITLLGPGGIGKSRLALRAAGDLAEQFVDGVVFVSLENAQGAEGAAAALMNALGVVASGERSLNDQLARWLKGRELLLILDGFEHLTGHAALLTDWLAAAPGLKLLVTSRERLDLRAEWLLSVGPLDLPTVSQAQTDEATALFAQGPGYLDHFGATRLFRQTMRRLSATDDLTSQEVGAIVEICHLLEGYPLAIELAAGWTRLLPVAEIAEEVSHNLSLLTSQAKDAPHRHRSLAAILDHSWALLNRREHEVLASLSVFRGGFTREGAAAVADASLVILSALADKSWLQPQPGGRYQIHTLIRHFCAGKLAESVETDRGERARERHCKHCASLYHSLNQLGHPDTALVLRAEAENLWVAWRWALDNCRWELLIDLASCLRQVADVQGELRATKSEFDAALKMAEEFQEAGEPDQSQVDSRQRFLITLLFRQASICGRLGLLTLAEAHCERSLAILEESRAGDPLLAWAHYHLAAIYSRQGRHETAYNIFREVLGTFQRVGIGWHICHLELGLVSLYLGEWKQAQRHLEDQLKLEAEEGIYGNRWTAFTLHNLSRALRNLGDYAGARKKAQEGLHISQGMNDRMGVGYSLVHLGRTAMVEENYPAAQEYYSRSLTIAQDSATHTMLADSLRGLGQVAFGHGDYAAAQRLYEECLGFEPESGPTKDRGRTWVALGELHLATGADEEARDDFLRALAESGEVADLLSALVGLAHCHQRTGKESMAVELLSFVRQSRLTGYPTRQRTIAALDELATELDRDQFRAAVSAGRNRELTEIVTALTTSL